VSFCANVMNEDFFKRVRKALASAVASMLAEVLPATAGGGHPPAQRKARSGGTAAAAREWRLPAFQQCAAEPTQEALYTTSCVQEEGSWLEKSVSAALLLQAA